MPPEPSVGERLASLEARFDGFQSRFDHFQSQSVVNQAQILAKLDKIDAAFDARRDKVNERFATLEAKTPAIVQQIVLVLTTGIVMAVASYFFNQLP